MGAASSTNIAKTVANATSNVLNKVMQNESSEILPLPMNTFLLIDSVNF